jgi:hypothetical protein
VRFYTLSATIANSFNLGKQFSLNQHHLAHRTQMVPIFLAGTEFDAVMRIATITQFQNLMNEKGQ